MTIMIFMTQDIREEHAERLKKAGRSGEPLPAIRPQIQGEIFHGSGSSKKRMASALLFCILQTTLSYFFFFAVVFFSAVFFAPPHGAFVLQAMKNLLFIKIYFYPITQNRRCQLRN